MSEFLLNEVCELIVDCPHTTANDEGKGFPLVRTPNIGKGRLVYDGMHRVCEDVYNKRNARAIPQENDLIFAREATAGNVALIQKGEKVCLGQRTVLIRPNQEKVNPAFLTYFLLAPKQQYNLLSTANGATVAHVNLPTIRNLKIDLPELPIQQRIATILSRYDSLIENYQKQIKLLEESAQRLYKEWFIDFRFPGHENTKIVDGVPEGWEKKKITELVNVQYGYAFDGKLFNSNSEGMPILRIRNIPDGITSDYTTEEASADYVVHNGDIVVGMDGIFHINTWSGGDAYLVQRACSFRPIEEVIKGFIFLAIKEPIKYFEQTLVGSTVAHLGKKHIDSIEILVPNRKELFKSLQDIFNQRQNMLYQIRHLTEARDRLLPKLMSEEIKIN